MSLLKCSLWLFHSLRSFKICSIRCFSHRAFFWSSCCAVSCSVHALCLQNRWASALSAGCCKCQAHSCLWLFILRKPLWTLFLCTWTSALYTFLCWASDIFWVSVGSQRPPLPPFSRICLSGNSSLHSASALTLTSPFSYQE